MAHWRHSFPSKYLQASDLDDGPLVGTIKGFKHEDIGSGDSQQRKPVISFVEPHIKRCVLNPTRAEAIEVIVGNPDPDKWLGRRIKLVRGSTRYQGKKVACIAIEAPGDDDLDSAMPTLDEEAP